MILQVIPERSGLLLFCTMGIRRRGRHGGSAFGTYDAVFALRRNCHAI